VINNAAWNDPVPLLDVDSLTPEIWDIQIDLRIRVKRKSPVVPTPMQLVFILNTRWKVHEAKWRFLAGKLPVTL